MREKNVRYTFWRSCRLGLLLGLLLGTLACHGQETTAEEDSIEATATVPPVAATRKLVVPPGYYLFPIRPGQVNFLAGSMGELRPNHFHGGLDIKTGGGVNQPVYASADGYISRLKQSSFGYGNVLYITHPNGTTTVYGHLNEFRGPVLAALRRQQYKAQQYDVEMHLSAGQFPVKRGEVVALSGNTGGSAGPHLHWEVRDAQDRQLNPLQWGGFEEIKDHLGPVLQAVAVEPLRIGSRVRGRFERALLLPALQPAPGATTVLSDTVRCFGTVGLLVQGFDRFDGAWNKNGIQRVRVQVNGQPHYEHLIDAVPFPHGSRQINNFVDYFYQRTSGRMLQKLWIDDGNDLTIYQPAGAGRGLLHVAPGRIYQVDIELADSYNNKAAVRLVLRGETPAYTKTGRPAAARRPTLSHEITRNLLKVKGFTAAADTGAAPTLRLWLGSRQLTLRPSYTVAGESTFLYDLRAGLPDSMGFGSLTKRLDRFTPIPSGRETSYTTPQLNLVFGPQTLFDTLFLATGYRPAGPAAPETWTLGPAVTPFYLPVRLTLRPAQAVADRARTAIYRVSARGGRAYVGGTWDEVSQHISANIKELGQFRLYADTTAPKGQYLGRSGGQLLFRVGDDLSGLASFRLLIGGRFRLLRFEHKNSTLFTIAGDTLGPALRGPAELHLTDQAGNARVMRLSL